MHCSPCWDARLENIGSPLLNNYIRAAEECQQGGGGGVALGSGSFGWQAFSLASGSRPQGELMQLCGFTSQHASVHGVGVSRWPLKLITLDLDHLLPRGDG